MAACDVVQHAAGQSRLVLRRLYGDQAVGVHLHVAIGPWAGRTVIRPRLEGAGLQHENQPNRSPERTLRRTAPRHWVPTAPPSVNT